MTIWNLQDDSVRGLRRGGVSRVITRHANYDRARMLPGLIPLAVGTINGAEPGATQAIVRMLARALRAERVRGRCGHCTYDPEKHLRLYAAFHAECRALKQRPADRQAACSAAA